LARCAKDLGEDVSPEEIETMIEMADRHKLNAVNLEDFLALMR
jgi:hypothetical protein